MRLLLFVVVVGCVTADPLFTNEGDELCKRSFSIAVRPYVPPPPVKPPVAAAPVINSTNNVTAPARAKPTATNDGKRGIAAVSTTRYFAIPVERVRENFVIQLGSQEDSLPEGTFGAHGASSNNFRTCHCDAVELTKLSRQTRIVGNRTVVQTTELPNYFAYRFQTNVSCTVENDRYLECSGASIVLGDRTQLWALKPVLHASESNKVIGVPAICAMSVEPAVVGVYIYEQNSFSPFQFDRVRPLSPPTETQTPYHYRDSGLSAMGLAGIIVALAMGISGIALLAFVALSPTTRGKLKFKISALANNTRYRFARWKLDLSNKFNGMGYSGHLQQLETLEAEMGIPLVVSSSRGDETTLTSEIASAADADDSNNDEIGYTDVRQDELQPPVSRRKRRNKKHKESAEDDIKERGVSSDSSEDDDDDDDDDGNSFRAVSTKYAGVM